MRRGDGDGDGITTLTSASVPQAEARSVAVLPFDNTDGDAENEHFSEGLTDELIGALGKVRGLKVAARTSTFALRAKASEYVPSATRSASRQCSREACDVRAIVSR